MPDKKPSQFQVLPPFQRPLVERVESGLRALNLLLSALRGRTITDIDAAGSLALQENPTAYTISGGVIALAEGSGQNTASRSFIVVDTEGGAATDDLDTINGGRDGMILLLRIKGSDREVRVMDSTGNISLDTDIVLSNPERVLPLFYCSALSKWLSLVG